MRAWENWCKAPDTGDDDESHPWAEIVADAIRTAQTEARNAALEEAAQQCEWTVSVYVDDSNSHTAAPLLREAAAAIRALKGAPS